MFLAGALLRARFSSPDPVVPLIPPVDFHAKMFSVRAGIGRGVAGSFSAPLSLTV